MSKSELIIRQIDFELLRKQKSCLLESQGILKSLHASNTNEIADNFDGIIHLMDAIQDHAVNDLGYSEGQIFKG